MLDWLLQVIDQNWTFDLSHSSISLHSITIARLKFSKVKHKMLTKGVGLGSTVLALNDLELVVCSSVK